MENQGIIYNKFSSGPNRNVAFLFNFIEELNQKFAIAHKRRHFLMYDNVDAKISADTIE